MDKKKMKEYFFRIDGYARKIVWISFLYVFLACLTPFIMAASLLKILPIEFGATVILFIAFIISSIIVLGLAMFLSFVFKTYKELMQYEKEQK